jgi:hypothetical protein
MKDVVDSRHNANVVEFIAGWMQGHASQTAHCRALTDSGTWTTVLRSSWGRRTAHVSVMPWLKSPIS